MFARIRTLFGIFFYLSLVTLGGGLAMLPMMRVEFVEKRKWLTDDEMVDTVAAMQSMPGIIASNMGVLLGFRIAGFWGAVASVAGGVLPPFLSIVVLASIVARLREYPVVSHVFLGVRAAVAALILCAVIGLGRKVLQAPQWRGRAFSWSVAFLSFLALGFLGASAVWVLLGAGVTGWLWSRLAWRRAPSGDRP